MTQWDNMPTVVVVRVPCNGGLLMIRRALEGHGHGRLALPGGYQMRDQTWQQAGAAEVLEETGVRIEPDSLRFVSIETALDARVNVLVCEHDGQVRHEGAFEHDHEVSEVLVVTEPVETAFPIHTEAVRQFFSWRSGKVPTFGVKPFVEG